MAEDPNESTRVMPVGGAEERTMVAQPPIGAGSTQMGSTVACAVCGTQNPALETYCVECGFLLSSAPGTSEGADEPPALGPELAEVGSGRRFPLQPGVNIVGREGGDVLLMDGTVSRRHAQVEVQDGAVTITDLGSTNGTSVDGQRLAPNTPTPVRPGATIRFGNAELSLVLPGQEPAVVASSPVEATQVIGPAEAVGEALVTEPPIVTADALHPEPAAREGEQPVAQLRPTKEDGLVIQIYEGSNTIGRRAANDTVISGDPYVSGRHAEITCDNTGCYIADLGSTNGTVVNGTKLVPEEKQLLLDGDEVAIGQGTYVFETIPIELPEPSEESGQPGAAQLAGDLVEAAPTPDTAESAE